MDRIRFSRKSLKYSSLCKIFNGWGKFCSKVWNFLEIFIWISKTGISPLGMKWYVWTTKIYRKKFFRKNFSIFRMRQSVFQKWRRESGIFLKLRYMFVQNILYRIRGYFSDPLIFQRSFLIFFLRIGKTWKLLVELKRVFENSWNLQKKMKKNL